MKMKKTMAMVLSLALLFSMALVGCDTSSSASKSASSAPSASSASSASSSSSSGDEKVVVGVALPWLGTQNWKEAQKYFDEKLTAAGFKPMILQADNKSANQLAQIEAMIEQGAKIIVVAPVDAAQLTLVLEKAKEQGVYIISYDRLIENTTAIDGVVQYGSIETGRLQGEALLKGLATRGPGPYNIEIFAGCPTDPNAVSFYEGALQVLQPLIDNGDLIVVSKQTDFATVSTPEWNSPKAQARMDTLLAGFYSDKEIHGVLVPNDSIARAIITSCEQAGQPLPITSGLDAENESVVWVWEGRQYCTIDKPTLPLVDLTMDIIKSLQDGKGMPKPDSITNNGKIDVNLYELTPTIVTKDNIKDVFKNDEERMALMK